MKSQIYLFLKGFAMGTVDIVPGVSGSTVAVLFGIYERFINALKNINTALIKSIFAPLRHRFSSQSREQFKAACSNADLPWLINLFLGLAFAFVIASFIIPSLIESYPVVMRGLFFGLVLGSIITPFRQISKISLVHLFTIALFAASFYFLLGLQFQPPAALSQIVSDGTQTLTQICAQAPCFTPPADVLSLSQNASIQNIMPSPDSIIPAGVSVTIAKPYFLYCFFAGFCAICAMLMPGISGSFILLVLGCYYFMLSAAKGFIHALSAGQFLPMNLLYIGCFALGAVTGIALFSRVLSWLLKTHRNVTLAAIIGILLGCLRAVWPFKEYQNDILINIIPDTFIAVIPALIAAMAGLSLVFITIVIQSKYQSGDTSHQPLQKEPSHDA